MDFGSEISQKIKAAIKTKLQDLGSYVDDELPEYIMVMLGNKRSKEQMTEDLTLFLGDNTLTFIDWLLNLVDKLKDVTSLIDSLPSDNTIITPDDTLNDNTVESKPEQNTKQIEAKDKKKSSRTTSKEYSQPKSATSSNSRSEKLWVSSSVDKHANRRGKTSNEEETPLRMQMPSVVRVQEKRPSLPPSQQATCTLLKRAVAEAHLSVTKMNLPHSHTYDPMSPPSPIKIRGIEEKRQQKEMLLQQHRELQRQLRENDVDINEEEEPRNGDYENTEQDKEIKEVEAKPSSRDSHMAHVPSSNVAEVENEPLIELQVSEAEALEYSSETVKGDTRIVAFADSQTVNGSEEEKNKRQRKRAVKSRDRPKSPKFIVTLDGVDSDLEDKYEKRSKKTRHKKRKTEFDDYVEVDTSNMATNPETVPPTPEKPEYIPPAIEQVMFRVDPNSDDEEMPHLPLPGKQQENCKFWPDCNNGTKCPFYHPTAPCRTFPNCKFAEKCMFIHPICKFDGRCANVACPYTHKLKNKLMNPVTAVAPITEPKIDDSLPTLSQLTPCKFFPGCTRSNCPFQHPKPTATKVCRYGSACSRIDCKFSHPPKKAALKWVSPSLHLSERAFAVPAAGVTDMPVTS